MLVQVIEGNNTLFNTQHCFRNKHSCLNKFSTSISRHVLQLVLHIPRDDIYLHFHKLLHKVPHELLLSKFKLACRCSRQLDCVDKWLAYGEKPRSTQRSRSGSLLVLRSILFIMCINDAKIRLKFAISKSAHDTKLKGPSQEQTARIFNRALTTLLNDLKRRKCHSILMNGKPYTLGPETVNIQTWARNPYRL